MRRIEPYHIKPELIEWVRGKNRQFSLATSLGNFNGYADRETELFAPAIDESGTPHQTFIVHADQFLSRVPLLRAPQREAPFVYLASPFSHPDEAVQLARYQTVCKVAADLHATRKAYAYAPIAHSYALYVEGNLRGTFDFWSEFDFGMIDRCDEMWICDMDGWQQSHGVTREIEYANGRGKEIRLIDTRRLTLRRIDQLDEEG